ncbi:preprotein translocase subunit SecA [Jannaschia ovalis]|uniref:Protein translocase subunit SecA n=1 Tax=Jannaschia ovalis TaxID=3038773 RepID=A0ABY8L717_9RHOB|nr:translocase [Jannaschia sp. GRR-S6-38]WGH77171.1 translocase [Jannaschia sp. GRR-S6-38]
MSDASPGALPGPPPGLSLFRRMVPAPEAEAPLDWRFRLQRAAAWASQPVAASLIRRRALGRAAGVARMAEGFRALDEAELVARIAAARPRAELARPLARPACELLALLSALASHRLGLMPFPNQIAGVLVLASGRLAEMETGSGKTLTAALAACLVAAMGERVHVITANDYLAARDAAALEPLAEALGFSVGLVTSEVEPAARPAAYRCHITHGSNQEIAFDYLRDRIRLGAEAGPLRLALDMVAAPAPRGAGITMTGLPFAIVDEADSVLIDECRTPLILSANADPDPDWAEQAAAFGAALEEGRDFSIDRSARQIELTGAGRRRLREMALEMGGIWRNTARREHAATLAISARNLFRRDEHYLVEDGAIRLIDEYTGRVSPDRALSDGLHQLIEAKEGVEITGRREIRGRMTYQRFFRRYRRLAGMTGTAREVAAEMRAVYGLRVVPVPPPRPSRRRNEGGRILRDEVAKWAEVLGRVRDLQAAGRPVLIATRTVRASEAVSQALTDAGLDHALLNAAQSGQEAEIIAAAGQPGALTVATNMAGRGVDIGLHEAVHAAGGLHVILTELHEAGRIDRQVIGRCARQGDPGSCEAVLSWTDPLIEGFGGLPARLRLGGLGTFRRAQRRAERLHARARTDLLRHDLRREEQFGFAGRVE